MSAIQTLPRDAGARFEEAIGFAFDDAMQGRLRYHLLRLAVVGLDREEVPLIVDLARRTFENADVTDEVAAIRERPGVTVLATAIAGVVERSHPGDATFAARAEVLIGAVVGAYAGLVDAGNPDATDATTAAVLGAVGAGTAVSVSRFIQQRIAEVGVAGYLRMDEQV